MSQENEDLILSLRDALADVAQTLDWQAHGCCRGFSERLLPSSEAVEVARVAIARANKYMEKCDE